MQQQQARSGARAAGGAHATNEIENPKAKTFKTNETETL
jgi:hypothetical protein